MEKKDNSNDLTKNTKQTNTQQTNTKKTKRDKPWHNCSECDYKTKNRDAARVHLRTKHNIHYCGYCMEQFGEDRNGRNAWRNHCQKVHGKKIC